MKGKNLDAGDLDKVVGGAIYDQGSGFSISVDGRTDTLSVVKNGRVHTYLKENFECNVDCAYSNLSDAQFSRVKEMVYGGKEYSIAQVKQETGVDLAKIFEKL